MRNLRTAATLSCLAALGVPALADASHVTKPARARPRTTVKAFASLTQLALVDLADPGFSLGDESVFSDDLRTRRDGKRIGSDGGVCTVVHVTDAATQTGILKCNVSFSLRHGQVSTQSLVPVAHAALSGTETESITGGTGRYRGATGEARVTFLNATEAKIRLSMGA